MAVGCVHTGATESVRGRPRTTRGGDPAVGRTAMTRTPMGPHWPGHSPRRETKREFPRCVAGSLHVRVGTDGRDRPNPVDGFLRVDAEEEVNLQRSIG
jgi:hypothetical protein